MGILEGLEEDAESNGAGDAIVFSSEFVDPVVTNFREDEHIFHRHVVDGVCYVVVIALTFLFDPVKFFFPFELLRVIFVAQVAGEVVGMFVGEVIREAELAVTLSARRAIFHRAVVRGEGVRQLVGESEIEGDGLQVFVLIAD